MKEEFKGLVRKDEIFLMVLTKRQKSNSHLGGVN